MQTVWKGVISFGLVSIPVQLFAATEEHGVSFRQIHVSDGGQIRYRRVCSLDGEEVPFDDIARGYELPDGQVVVLTDEDFAELPLASSRAIEVLGFADADTVDPVRLSRSYYCDPTGSDAKAYVLLREALQRTGKVALVKVALRTRESPAVLHPRDGILVLHLLLWPDEVRKPRFRFLRDDVTPPRAAGGGGLHPHVDRHPRRTRHGRPVPGGTQGAGRGQGGRQAARARTRADPRRQPHGGAAAQRRAGQAEQPGRRAGPEAAA